MEIQGESEGTLEDSLVSVSDGRMDKGKERHCLLLLPCWGEPLLRSFRSNALPLLLLLWFIKLGFLRGPFPVPVRSLPGVLILLLSSFVDICEPVPCFSPNFRFLFSILWNFSNLGTSRNLLLFCPVGV